MPAATRKQQSKPKEHVKGLETDEALDSILSQYTEKRSQQILNDASLHVKEAPKPELGSKAVRRQRRRELQARGALAQQSPEKHVDENQDLCLKCNSLNCRMVQWLPGEFPGGAYDCALCLTSGNAGAGVWHCGDCGLVAHVSCFARKKEALLAEVELPLQPTLEADCPKPSLAWDPLSLTGPHMAIGAGAGVRNVGEVALD